MSHRALYWIVGGTLAVLLVVMLVAWEYDRSSEEADQKAGELIAAFEADGLPTPANPDQIARVLGTDGGAICETAGEDIPQGLLRIHLGVGGAFYTRPVTVDRRVLQGELLVVETYCPERLDDFREFVEDHDFDDVIRD
ncbi:MAG: hypothetical protein ACRDNG_09570 [Gaiellaceae bacterium]